MSDFLSLLIQDRSLLLNALLGELLQLRSQLERLYLPVLAAMLTVATLLRILPASHSTESFVPPFQLTRTKTYLNNVHCLRKPWRTMDNIELSFSEPSSSKEIEEVQDDDETTLTKDELIMKLKEENIFFP